MDKYNVRKVYIDKETKELHDIGTKVELTDKRAAEIKKFLGDNSLLKIEEPKKEEPKKETKKTKDK